MKLLLTGVDDNEATYAKLVADLKLTKHVHLLGVIDHAGMPDLYNKLDIACFPSTHEAFGVSVLEASSVGIPVLAFKTEGLVEVIEDRVTGFLVEEGDFNIFIERLIYLIDNHKERVRLGSNGREFVEKNFQWDSSVESMMWVYKNLLSEMGAPSAQKRPHPQNINTSEPE